MKKTGFFLLCFILIILSSCWDAKELSDIGIVVMTGFDLDDDGQERVTIFSVQPFGQASEIGEAATTWVGTASGRSTFEAFRNLRRISTRKLIWVQNKIILIGAKKAEESIEGLIDLIARSREFRYDNAVFVTSGRADELMQTPANIEKSLFRELMGMIDNTAEWSKGYALSVKDFSLNSLESFQHGFVIGNMGFYNTERLPFTIDHREYLKLYWKETGHSIVYIGGGGVIDKNRLIGWLSPTELRGYLILSNQAEEGFTINATLDEEDSDVTAAIIDLKTEVSFPKVSQKAASALIKVKSTALLLEVEGTLPEYDETAIRRIENELEKEIMSELILIIRRAQDELRSDFLGFHTDFRIKHAKEWEKLESNWCEFFCGMHVDYDVDVKIMSEGLLGRTIRSGGR